jgi:hypothetical protein
MFGNFRDESRFSESAWKNSDEWLKTSGMSQNGWELQG